MFRNDYDWSSEVAAIKAPTLLIFGDTDYIRPAHLVQFFELLGGGKYRGLAGSDASSARLAIIPNMTHSRIFSAPQLAPSPTPFSTQRLTNNLPHSAQRGYSRPPTAGSSAAAFRAPLNRKK
jgi:pimeloyl-ACP methyl ester carboxylesterase